VLIATREHKMKELNIAKTSAFCMATSRSQAILIRDDLLGAGFSHDDISTLFPDKATSRDFAHTKHTKAPEGASAGAATGGLLGGALGWLLSVGTLPLPGIGPLIAVGHTFAALSSAAVGAAIGGIAGALIGTRIPEYEAKRFAGKVNPGSVLISVHAESSGELQRAKAVFKAAGAQDIGSRRECPAPAPGGAGNILYYQWPNVEDSPSPRRRLLDCLAALW
jgi:hypothetical protein